HGGGYGGPVPSRAADRHEIWELAGVLKEHGRGVVEAAFGPDLHVDECAQLSDDIGRPVSWAAIVTLARDPALAADLVRRVEAREGQVYPQITCRPLVVQIALSDPFPFANVPSFGEILSLPHAERAARYADEQWRAEARPGIRAAWGAMLDTAVVAETAKHSELVEGPALGVLAAERGVDSLDVMVDLSLDESLETRFRVTMTNESEEQIGELLG